MERHHPVADRLSHGWPHRHQCIVIADNPGAYFNAECGARDPPITSTWLLAAAQFLVYFMSVDFVGYWVHRRCHTNAHLWHLHKPHHTAETLTPWTLFRQHPIEFFGLNIIPAVVGGAFTGVVLYVTGSQVEPENVDSILDAIRLAPSSSGLQPFKVLVISDGALKARLQPICANQQQIGQSSHLLVFAAWDAYTPERINDFFAYSNGIRNLPASVTDDHRLSLLDSFASMSREQQHFHAAKQCYIALGFALLTAAERRVDATPMEGFDNQALDALLDLREQGLASAVLMTLGYRDVESDWLAKLDKVRRTKPELFVAIK